MNRFVVFLVGFLAGGLVLFAISAFFPRIIIQHTTIQNQAAQADSLLLETSVKPKKKDTTKQERIEKIIGKAQSESQSSFPESDSSEQEFQIARERLIGNKTVQISFPAEFRDSSASAQLNTKFDEQGFNKTLQVEFWESPIDFMGYKLSKTKLVLYGFLPQELFTLTYQEGDLLVMEVDGKSISLKKTEKYRTISF